MRRPGHILRDSPRGLLLNPRLLHLLLQRLHILLAVHAVLFRQTVKHREFPRAAELVELPVHVVVVHALLRERHELGNRKLLFLPVILDFEYRFRLGLCGRFGFGGLFLWLGFLRRFFRSKKVRVFGFRRTGFLRHGVFFKFHLWFSFRLWLGDCLRFLFLRFHRSITRAPGIPAKLHGIPRRVQFRARLNMAYRAQHPRHLPPLWIEAALAAPQ